MAVSQGNEPLKTTPTMAEQNAADSDVVSRTEPSLSDLSGAVGREELQALVALELSRMPGERLDKADIAVVRQEGRAPKNWTALAPDIDPKTLALAVGTVQRRNCWLVEDKEID